jgi:hypothetical protein
VRATPTEMGDQARRAHGGDPSRNDDLQSRPSENRAPAAADAPPRAAW